MIKDKSAENILNNRGTRIHPCGTLTIIFNKKLYDEFVFVRCYLLLCYYYVTIMLLIRNITNICIEISKIPAILGLLIIAM